MNDAPPLHLVATDNAGRLDELSDDDLMLLVRDGHKPAFHVVLCRHRDAVIGFACRFLNDRDAGEEVAQEAFLTLWAERHSYRGRGRLKGYLLSIAVNRARSSSRSKRRNRAKVDALAQSTPDQQSGTALDELLESSRAREVHQHLAELPDSTRQVLVLRYLNELSLQEISDVTKMPTGTIKSHIFRGLKRLQASLTRSAP